MSEQSSSGHNSAPLPVEEINQYPSYFEPREQAPSGYYFKTIQLSRMPVSRYLHEDSSFSTEEDSDDTDVQHHKSKTSGCCACCAGKESKPSKFGTWDGVFVSCLLNIFGVIMFLRLTWVVGTVGLIQASLIILLASLVTFITTLSMSAVCTNGIMGSGGAYFLISRSLGPQFGGSIGLLFSIGNSVGVSLYVIGFSETLAELITTLAGFQMFNEILWDIRIYGLATVVLLFIMVLFGVSWIVKLQIFLLGLLVFTMISIIVGAFLAPKPAEGFVGFTNLYNDNATTLLGNIDTFAASNSTETPPLSDTVSIFFTTFAVFFPAVTGIMAGTNISGDLKKPSENIPKGTLSAIGVSTFGYLLLAWIAGTVCVKTVPGLAFELGSPGLVYDYYMFTKVSFWGGIIYIGIFAATLSSALASLVGAPRILQAVCRDKLFDFPVFNFFGKGSGPEEEPIRGYFFTFVIACGCIMIGDLNLIAPLISMFFMLTYATINFACFAGSIGKTPGWRPSFQFYNEWVSLFGTVLCVGCMFLINIYYAIVAIVILFIIFGYLTVNKPKVKWGAAGDALTVTSTINNLLQLRKKETHVKNFRPNFLVLTRNPSKDIEMIKIFGAIRNKGKSLLITAHVMLGDFHTLSKKVLKNPRDKFLTENKIKGHLMPIIAQSYRTGAQIVYQSAGIGSTIEPNTVVISFLEKWRKASVEMRDEYVDIIRDCFELQKSAIVCRGCEELEDKLIGRVDVWWLVDDGGLPILLSYLLQLAHPKLSLRVMTIPANTKDAARHTVLITQMLKQFRIEAEVQVAYIDEGEVDESDIERYEKRLHVELDEEQRERTLRYFLLRGAMKEHSSDAALVLATMPFPRLTIDSTIWLGWLEMLSRNMPPTMFIRGNNENTLTFYV
eukprot:TRINITY_DN5655_c0_g1_i1.p1 TRINITY_DN5655_c0_g1~~TRINITY_DN5655_c0_g1_i1.p1  ORF type:complete len:895 (-),score=132.69 TRINITY_DN5655_c0_g1_i1:362-3046(-)